MTKEEIRAESVRLERLEAEAHERIEAARLAYNAHEQRLIDAAGVEVTDEEMATINTDARLLELRQLIEVAEAAARDASMARVKFAADGPPS